MFHSISTIDSFNAYDNSYYNNPETSNFGFFFSSGQRIGGMRGYKKETKPFFMSYSLVYPGDEVKKSSEFSAYPQTKNYNYEY
uniref:Uncharacterized protein n=1 Tax=Parastrongyloides trichosuri TaxID=131310 RepID=A0A0N4ZF62_PARTI